MPPSKRTDLCLLPVTLHAVFPPLAMNSQQVLDISLGMCPVTPIPAFTKTTA